MTIPAAATRPGNASIDAPHACGPADEHVGKLVLFGQFVGSWDLEWALCLLSGTHCRRVPGSPG